MREARVHSIVISLMPAPDSPGVTFYKAEAEGNSSTNSSCLMTAATTVIECELDGLDKDTEYMITARACVAAGEADICGGSIELTAKTLPQGKWSMKLLILHC